MNADIKINDLKRHYDEQFIPSQSYIDSMPDLQNNEYTGKPIDFVGIHNFHLPIRILQKDGNTQEVRASITGEVSLEAAKRGINMSRIIRTFYNSADDIFDSQHLMDVLQAYKNDLQSFDAHILMNFQYRIWQPALRSVKMVRVWENEDGERCRDVEKEGGWQYYNVTFDINLDKNGEFKELLWVDFIYSSACPCSTELSVHAANNRGVFGIPHSQRSVARIGVEFKEQIWIEDIVKMCQDSLTTETLVFCKRADEQAFAEKNGAQPKFVEDAIRLIKNQLDACEQAIDYKIMCSHQESLHNHNAVAVTTKGIENSIFNHHVSVGEWMSMMV